MALWRWFINLFTRSKYKWRRLLVMATLVIMLCLVFFHHSYVPVETAHNYGGRHSHVERQIIASELESWKKWVFSSLGFGTSQFTPTQSIDCNSPPQSGYEFCKAGGDPLSRAMDLTSRLTVQELIAQTSTIAPAIPRLGLKAYNWRSNCLHGWTLSGGHWPSNLKWTVFPAPIGLGATFNKDLLKLIGKVTSTEGRALHNEMLVQFNGSSTEAAGLNCFSPNVNLFRDPRWGRGQETFGEDPFLISVVGNAYTIGLQEGKDLKYLKVAACAKHFAVHSGPEEQRLHFRANVTLHDLFDTYLPSFKSQVVGAAVVQIMPAYSGMRCENQPDGTPDTASSYLLKTILRDMYGAQNISVVSDNGAVVAVSEAHHYVATKTLGAAVCMNATTDLDLGYDRVYPDYLMDALNNKLVRLDTIKDAVTRSFYLRMRVGDFDPPSMVPYQFIDKTSLDTAENKALNLQAARESIVLLKNLLHSLPLHKDGIKHMAVIGPNANTSRVLLSNYEGIPSSIVTVLQGITNAVNTTQMVVDFAPGCYDIKCKNDSGFAGVEDIVQAADVVVMVMGLDFSVEGENHDRAQTTCNGENVAPLGLPGCQKKLVESVVNLNHKVVLVLVNGGPLSIPDLNADRGIIGIIEAFYPGAAGGTAVADVLFGEYNPSGKMPVSVYESIKDLPPVEDYNMTKGVGRTYRYSTAEPLFPFGYGLSYSDFVYSDLKLSPSSLKICDSLTVSVVVSNTAGSMAGEEVVQVYLEPPTMSDKPFFPKKQLVGFEKVYLQPSEMQKVTFELNPYLLSLVGEDGVNYLFPGSYGIQIGVDGTLSSKFTMGGTSPVKVEMCTESPQCLAC